MSCSKTYRERISPVDVDKSFGMILVDRCGRCGKVYPVFPEKLTEIQKNWIEERNRLTDEFNGNHICD